MPADPLLALTLWPEWAWTIASGQSWPDDLVRKLVENRGWHPGRRLPVGARLAIHAGAHLGGRSGQEATREAVAGVLHMFKRANPNRWRPYDNWTIDLMACPRSAIVCTATIDGYDQRQLTGWDVPDAWHWRLRDVVVLPEPIPCRGAQGLWKAPDSAVAALKATGAA